MRLIDADELKELFAEVISGIAKKPEITKDLEHMVRASAMTIQMIDDAPTIDAVPVVRCKDCQWWYDNYRECGSPNWYPDQDGCVLQPAGMFCGWAERRTDERSD